MSLAPVSWSVLSSSSSRALQRQWRRRQPPRSSRERATYHPAENLRPAKQGTGEAFIEFTQRRMRRTKAMHRLTTYLFNGLLNSLID